MNKLKVLNKRLLLLLMMGVTLSHTASCSSNEKVTTKKEEPSKDQIEDETVAEQPQAAEIIATEEITDAEELAGVDRVNELSNQLLDYLEKEEMGIITTEELKEKGSAIAHELIDVLTSQKPIVNDKTLKEYGVSAMTKIKEIATPALTKFAIKFPDFTEKIENAKDAVGEWINSAKPYVKKGAEQTKESAKKVLEQTKEYYNSLKDKIEEKEKQR